MLYSSQFWCADTLSFLETHVYKPASIQEGDWTEKYFFMFLLYTSYTYNTILEIYSIYYKLQVHGYPPIQSIEKQ